MNAESREIHVIQLFPEKYLNHRIYEIKPDGLISVEGKFSNPDQFEVSEDLKRISSLGASLLKIAGVDRIIFEPNYIVVQREPYDDDDFDGSMRECNNALRWKFIHPKALEAIIKFIKEEAPAESIDQEVVVKTTPENLDRADLNGDYDFQEIEIEDPEV